MHGPSDDQESIATIQAYLDADGTLLDTGGLCGSGHNKWLIRRAPAERNRDDAVLSVKFGAAVAAGAATTRVRRPCATSWPTASST